MVGCYPGCGKLRCQRRTRVEGSEVDSGRRQRRATTADRVQTRRAAASDAFSSVNFSLSAASVGGGVSDEKLRRKSGRRGQYYIQQCHGRGRCRRRSSHIAAALTAMGKGSVVVSYDEKIRRKLRPIKERIRTNRGIKDSGSGECILYNYYYCAHINVK